tara:strand:- start:4349 stop:4711 length:363 start_codon:yes stop_codon:yes gene_type:complete
MQTVAVIGASGDRSKFGNKALRGFQRAGYKVVPINTKEKEIEGLKAYSTVLEVPFNIDIATFYVHPKEGEKIVEELAQKNIPEVWINPGAESASLIGRADELGIHAVLGCSLVAIGETLE